MVWLFFLNSVNIFFQRNNKNLQKEKSNLKPFKMSISVIVALANFSDVFNKLTAGQTGY